jgi:hypothetical protein
LNLISFNGINRDEDDQRRSIVFVKTTKKELKKHHQKEIEKILYETHQVIVFKEERSRHTKNQIRKLQLLHKIQDLRVEIGTCCYYGSKM